MSKEEFLALAEARYEALAALKEGTNFYEHEKKFDQVWVELGRQVLEKTISEVPVNPRKKTSLPAATEKSK